MGRKGGFIFAAVKGLVTKKKHIHFFYVSIYIVILDEETNGRKIKMEHKI